MKINVLKQNVKKLKTGLLFIIEKSEKEKLDFLKNNFSADRIIKISLKKFEPKEFRILGSKIYKMAEKIKQNELSIKFPSVKNYEECSQALIEGIFLASYRFDRYKTKKKCFEIEKINLVSQKNIRKIQKGVSTGEIISKYVSLTRDFVNNPSNRETPIEFSKAIIDISKKNKLGIMEYNQKALEDMGMGCLIGVSSGSKQEPRMLVIEYKGSRKKDFYALVGKGVTFDSGGLSLKPSENMGEMKGDMSGAATVAAAINAAAELKLPVNIKAVLPCVENMPGKDAMKPGDVLLSMSGKTVEIIDTDCEGRLILADVIYYISKEKPKAIIDMATLTGACTRALGYETAGIFGTDKELIQKLINSGSSTHENCWELPITREHKKAIESDIADIKNMGYSSGVAGASTAAAFLKAFTNNTTWAHIDIAGVHWAKKERNYIKKGPTGWGVRLLLDFFKNNS